MEFLKQNKKLITISAATIVAIGVMLLVIILPYYSSLADSTDNLHDKRVQLATLVRERTNIEQTQREYSNIKTSLDTLDSIFVDPEEVLEVISALEAIAEDVSVNQEISLVGEPSAKNGIKLRLSISGTWGNVLRFVQSLETQTIYISLTDPTISTSGTDVVMTFNAQAHAKS